MRLNELKKRGRDGGCFVWMDNITMRTFCSFKSLFAIGFPIAIMALLSLITFVVPIFAG